MERKKKTSINFHFLVLFNCNCFRCHIAVARTLSSSSNMFFFFVASLIWFLLLSRRLNTSLPLGAWFTFQFYRLNFRIRVKITTAWWRWQWGTATPNLKKNHTKSSTRRVQLFWLMHTLTYTSNTKLAQTRFKKRHEWFLVAAVYALVRIYNATKPTHAYSNTNKNERDLIAVK